MCFNSLKKFVDWFNEDFLRSFEEKKKKKEIVNLHNIEIIIDTHKEKNIEEIKKDIILRNIQPSIDETDWDIL